MIDTVTLQHEHQAVTTVHLTLVQSTTIKQQEQDTPAMVDMKKQPLTQKQSEKNQEDTMDLSIIALTHTAITDTQDTLTHIQATQIHTDLITLIIHILTLELLTLTDIKFLQKSLQSIYKFSNQTIRELLSMQMIS